MIYSVKTRTKSIFEVREINANVMIFLDSYHLNIDTLSNVEFVFH